MWGRESCGSFVGGGSRRTQHCAVRDAAVAARLAANAAPRRRSREVNAALLEADLLDMEGGESDDGQGDDDEEGSDEAREEGEEYGEGEHYD